MCMCIFKVEKALTDWMTRYETLLILEFCLLYWFSLCRARGWHNIPCHWALQNKKVPSSFVPNFARY